ARRTRSSGAFCSAARPRGCSRRRRRRLLPTRTSCSSAARTRWNTVTWATRIDLLSDTNPEIRKIVRALRAAAQSMTFDFVAQVDDDSFVNLPILFEILEYLPKERVYVGNMIDTVPQRGGLSKIVTPEYSVNIYLAAPSKVPVFAHGMGFIVSSDVALLMANMGLRLKSRANDDLILGVWFRNVEHLYYLHYWIWMFDHEEFGGMFAMPCDEQAILVHRSATCAARPRR
ncbi:unnamed protein product, partial [Prorocentrum cordatum]